MSRALTRVEPRRELPDSRQAVDPATTEHVVPNVDCGEGGAIRPLEPGVLVPLPLTAPLEDPGGAYLHVAPIVDVPLPVAGNQSEIGRTASDAHEMHADLALLHALMGHYARTLWDVQQVRVMMGNRVAAMERDGVPPAFRVLVVAAAAELVRKERSLDYQLERLARRHPMASFIQQAPGIGLPGFARLLGITGSLDRFATVSKLWAYLGMHVVDGGAPRRHRGETANWSSQGRMLCHQLGESIVKVGRGPYREAYVRKKAEYAADRPDWTQAHRHKAAMRYAVKLLLKELWLEWRRTVPQEGK